MAGPWEQYSTPEAAGPWSSYANQEPTAPEPTTPTGSISRTEKVLRGMKDPMDGLAQLFEHAMPQGFNDANHAVNNWLADKTGIFAKVPERNLSSLITGEKTGIDGLIAQQEKAYQDKRTAAGESGVDAYRIGGNIISPVNLVAASRLPAATTLLGRVGVGALGGAIGGAVDPVKGDDYWAEKAKQVGIGGALGGVAAPVIAGIGRLISPNASKNANTALLKSEGVDQTIGQSLGGWANRLEEKAQSFPFVGGSITAARQRGTDQLNRAAFNRALEPIGEKLPMTVAVGNDAVEHTGRVLGDAYNKLLPKLTTQADDVFAGKVQDLSKMVSEGALDPKYASLFDRTLKTRVLDKFQGQNTMSGQTLKDTESFLSTEIKRFGQSQDPDARLIGDAYKEVQAQLRGLVARTNPDHAKELSAINTGWANFKRVQNAAAKVGADDGVFTPSQLQNAVRVMDKSKDKARFAEGNALMQDLSSAAKSQLANKVPDSGTGGRVLAAGAAFANPLAAAAGTIGGFGAYSPFAQKILSAAVANRGASAEPIAEALKKASPMLGLGGAQVGLGLLNY